MRAVVMVLVALVATTALCVEEPSEEAKWLAEADRPYQAGDAGMAIYDYRLCLQRFPYGSRRDHAIYMIGESSRLALRQLAGILPAGLLVGHLPGQDQYKPLAVHLTKTYGFYADISEGDPYWYYDMRAYRELLRRYPKSEYADDARFLLVEPNASSRAWLMGGGPQYATTGRRVIAEYRAVLRDFPDTNRRAEIEGKIAELQHYVGE